ncbi:MAG: single-stranded DNA-binding protein [Parcubacteria group bacterium Licking1014_17]|nr:MAG: single-stranded DNA-binding protein [Parcubacteria group bacterium Licking1014_17]
MNLNKVFLIGRLAADPEARTTTGGQNVVTVRLVTNRVWNDRASGQKREQTEFHTIVVWGAMGDIVTRYLKKGQLACFEGRLQTRSWTGNDGQKRYRTEIVAENMQLGPKASGSFGGVSGEAKSPAPAAASEPEEEIPVINEDVPTAKPETESGNVEESEIDLKDIPF